MVIEAFLCAALILGASAYVATRPAQGPSSVDDALDGAATDALGALAGALTSDGEPLFAPLLRHALACSAAADPAACMDARPLAVDARLRTYLPPGASFDLALSNGVSALPLRPASAWHGPSSSASVLHAPEDVVGLVVPDLSCQSPSSTLLAEAVFLRAGRAQTSGSVLLDAPSGTVETARSADVWRAEIPAGDGVVLARRGSAEAQADLATCDLGALADALPPAIAASGLDTTAATAEIIPGREAVIAYDLAALEGLGGVSVERVRLEIHPPLATSGPLWTLDAGAAATGEVAWTVPDAAPYGCYPVVLRADLALDQPPGAQVEARKVGLLCVRLPTGELPVEPLYRIELRAWFPEAQA